MNTVKRISGHEFVGILITVEIGFGALFMHGKTGGKRYAKKY